MLSLYNIMYTTLNILSSKANVEAIILLGSFDIFAEYGGFFAECIRLLVKFVELFAEYYSLFAEYIDLFA